MRLPPYITGYPMIVISMLVLVLNGLYPFERTYAWIE